MHKLALDNRQSTDCRSSIELYGEQQITCKIPTKEDSYLPELTLERKLAN